MDLSRPTAPDQDFGSVVRDGLRPLLLLRIAPDGVVTVDAVADRIVLDEGVEADASTMRIDELLPAGLARRLTDGVAEVADRRSMVVVDVTNSRLGIESVRLVPLGADQDGGIDLVLALGEGSVSATVDELTRLPTRDVLAERWAHAVARGRRLGTSVSLLFCDLDGFKAVNDQLGHLVGDEVLRVVAGRLQSVIRDDDTVARFGGDEFAVVVNGGEGTAVEIAGRIVDALSRPVRLDGGGLTSIGVSVGAHSVDPADGGALTLDEAVERADRCMYAAKAGGGGAVHTGDPSIDRELHG
ncbi:MAG: GGDEF domain-containing protein [Actinomycetota bacterium]